MQRLVAALGSNVNVEVKDFFIGVFDRCNKIGGLAFLDGLKFEAFKLLEKISGRSGYPGRQPQVSGIGAGAG